MKEWHRYSKKELLALPTRQWDKVTSYRSILLLHTTKKHESGYNYFVVIGCKDGITPTEIINDCDSVWWENEINGTIRNDCSKSGATRFFSSRDDEIFEAGYSLGTITIKLIKDT